jgi:peroxiredoxin
MKYLKILWVAPIFAILLLIQCSSTSSESSAALILEGTIENANNLTATLTLPKKGNQNQVISTAEIDDKGEFKMELNEQPGAGIYKFSIGKQATNLIFNGEESNIKLNGKISDLRNYDYSIEGAPATQELLNALEKLKKREMNIGDVKEFVSNSENPLTGLFLGMLATRGSAQYASTFQKGLDRVKESYGESNPSYQMYAEVVQGLKKRSQGAVKVGDEAPDISMEGPEGNTYSLSDLEGKIVLLDFWASWCRPCRMANPHVVKVYDKYKDEGFTVFSVSLDGLDDRTKKKLGGNEDRINQYLQQSKQRWIRAIEKDNLKWDYHVSDLKKWDSEAAATYGVRSIPRTFLIDREGKIAAVNPRNNLEEELKQLLDSE